MRRSLLAVGLVGMALVSVSARAPGPAAAVAPGEVPPGSVSWQSAGDSYSSGEGVFGNAGACAQSREAYGPRAAAALRSEGWEIGSETFTACTGHLVEDYFNTRADSGGKRSLWQWGREQGGPARVDVIALSFGGNDIGFADLLLDCLDLPSSWTEAVAGFAPSGCDPSEEELRSRVDHLLDPARPCSGTRRSGRAGFDCDLDIGDRRGSIIDFYYDVVTDRLTDRGRLFVVGYPRLFAPVGQWPGWVKGYCQGVGRGDTEKLGRLAEHFNGKLREAVGRVNEALDRPRVHYVDRLARFAAGEHELCGTNEDWLNGLAADRGRGPGIRAQTSFHPTTDGHVDTAAALIDTVDQNPLTTPEPEGPFSPLPFRPIQPSDRRRFEDLLDATIIPETWGLDEGAYCNSLEVTGWTDEGDIDLFVSHSPDEVDHTGSECGGDGLSTFYAVRDGRVVFEGTACECEGLDEADSERFFTAVELLEGRQRVYADLGNTERGWYIDSTEIETG